jgi:hypothetical protein
MASDIEDGLKLIGDFMVDQLVKVLDVQGHRASGQLQDTMRSVVNSSAKGFSITIIGKDYAKFVEKGVPRGAKVSIEALSQWIEDKGIQTGELSVKSLAFAIQRKIFNEGTIQFRENKKGFVEVMLDANATLIFQMLTRLFTEQVAVSLSKTISKNKRILES